jgi:hypothetical protein
MTDVGVTSSVEVKKSPVPKSAFASRFERNGRRYEIRPVNTLKRFRQARGETRVPPRLRVKTALVETEFGQIQESGEVSDSQNPHR